MIRRAEFGWGVDQLGGQNCCFIMAYAALAVSAKCQVVRPIALLGHDEAEPFEVLA